MFHIIRWPLLVLLHLFTLTNVNQTFVQIILFTFIFVIFGLYVFVRQIVNAIEWMFACAPSLNFLLPAHINHIPGRGRKGQLRKRLRSARSYTEWKEAAQTMDEFLGFDLWKRVWKYRDVSCPALINSFIGRQRSLLRLGFGT